MNEHRKFRPDFRTVFDLAPKAKALNDHHVVVNFFPPTRWFGKVGGVYPVGVVVPGGSLSLVGRSSTLGCHCCWIGR